MKPMFSVVIPAFGRQELLNRALDSLMAQTFRDFEVIVVDDCSSPELRIDGYSGTSAKLVRLAANSGANVCRNTGIAASRGQYVCFLDSDDYWLPAKLESEYEVVQRGNPQLIVSLVQVLKPGGRMRAACCIPPACSLMSAILEHGCIIQTSGVTVHSSLLKAVRFNPHLRRHQDLDFYVALDLRGVMPEVVQEGNVIWDISHDAPSISRTTQAAESAAWLESVRTKLPPQQFTVLVRRVLLQRSARLLDVLRYARRFQPEGAAAALGFFAAATVGFAVRTAQRALLKLRPN